MMRNFGLTFVSMTLVGFVAGLARADDKDATPVIDAAIKALGGEEKLAKASSFTNKTKGTVLINDNDVPIKISTTMQGLDHQRGEFEIEFNGDTVKGVTILNGSKGWRKFGDMVMDLDDEGIAGARQMAYLVAIESTVLPIKGKGFKTELAPEEKINGKPAHVIKGTGPDGKSFTFYIDKETSLPTRMVATIMGFQGQETVQEVNLSDFKEFDGIKKATKTESKRDGNLFSKQEVTEFKIIEKPDASLFDEPK